MLIFAEELMMFVILMFLNITDSLMTVFNTLAGVSDFMTGYTSQTFLSYLSNAPAVKRAFLIVLAASVAVGGLFGLFAIIKNMAKGSRNIGSILGRVMFGILLSLMLAAGVLLALNAFSVLLKAVGSALTGNAPSLSSIVFSSCAEFINGYSMADVGFSPAVGMTVEKVLGTFQVPPLSIIPDRWIFNGMINPESFHYGYALICSFLLMMSVFRISLTLGKRVFEIVALIILTPVASVTVVLDEGERLRHWMGMIGGKTMISFGAVLGISTYAYLTGYLVGVSLGTPDLSRLFVLILIVGGVASIPSIMNFTAELIGEGMQAAHLPGGLVRETVRVIRDVGKTVHAKSSAMQERDNTVRMPFLHEKPHEIVDYRGDVLDENRRSRQ